MQKTFILIAVLVLSSITVQAQQQYKIGAIGFYNFENLFDTLDAPDIRDEEFTPSGDKLWNSKKYQEKMGNLAKVVSELGSDLTPDGVAVLGVSEVENRSVLEDFVKHPLIEDRNYQIIHEDSPDFRGIDVALLYNPKYFKPLGHKAIPLLIYNSSGKRKTSRDILYVAGEFDGEPIHLLVNHWPSRGGGEAATQPYRNAGALICKQVCDSLMQVDPKAKVIIMGDLNDDPISPSVKEVLNAQSKKKKVRQGGLYNPMYELFRKGAGTLAYRDAWSLFDQMLISKGLLEDEEGYRFYKVVVHNPPYLLQKSGRFQGYPFRTFGGDTYLGGYSDHFPVYSFLVKPIKNDRP